MTTKKYIPCGIRNNNPLNIRKSNDKWHGMATIQEDANFVTFKSMAYGYRAAWILLKNYRKVLAKSGKRFCLISIISRWAPLSENFTNEYIRAVVKIVNSKIMRNLFNDLSPFIKKEDIDKGEVMIATDNIQRSIGGNDGLQNPDSLAGRVIFTRIIVAMTCVENGIKPSMVDINAINEGWNASRY